MKTLIASCLTLIKQIEALKNEPTLLLVAPNIDSEILPTLFNVLKAFSPNENITLIVNGKGGQTTAARAIGILLNKYCSKLNMVVPYHCQSSFTALSLAANSIIAGDMAMFSPIDPSLDCEPQGALASEDIRVFSQMSKDWFGIESENTKTELLAALAGSVFPTTLSALYRSSIEMKEVANELINLGNSNLSTDARSKIVEKLLYGYHSHSFPINNTDLAQLGLPIVRDKTIESLSWDLIQLTGQFIGGAARASLADTKNDVLIATSEVANIRQVEPNSLAPSWITVKGEID